MTNKDKSTEKLRELIETREVYRVYYTIGEELHCIYVAAYEEELSSSENLMKSARKSPYFNAGMDRAYRL